MDIMTGLSAISETLKISKELRAVDSRIEQAEWKLKIADMVDKLLEAKEALIDAKETQIDLKKEIEALKLAAETANLLEDDNGLLFDLDEKGNRIGNPYCNQCYIKEQKKFRLIYRSRADFPYFCHNCDRPFKG